MSPANKAAFAKVSPHSCQCFECMQFSFALEYAALHACQSTAEMRKAISGMYFFLNKFYPHGNLAPSCLCTWRLQSMHTTWSQVFLLLFVTPRQKNNDSPSASHRKQAIYANHQGTANTANAVVLWLLKPLQNALPMAKQRTNLA